MKNWTLLDDARLLTLLNKGWTRKEIAADFGVTRNAICGRVHRLVYKPDEQPAMAEPTRNLQEYYFARKPNPHPAEWRIGQLVTVDYARAWSPETKWFVDWKGTGTIDIIAHGGAYIRVVHEGYVAWINDNNFCDVRLAAPAPS